MDESSKFCVLPGALTTVHPPIGRERGEREREREGERRGVERQREGGRERGGEREREEEEEEKGHTINELCITVLLLVLNLLCFITFYFI